MLIDAHCHLTSLNEAESRDNAENFNLDSIAHILKRAQAAGVIGCLVPSVVRSDWPKVLKVLTLKDSLWGAVGVHPQEPAPMLTISELSKAATSDTRIVGIGETGLDFSQSATQKEQERQIQLLKVHLQVASELNKVLIIHVRDAFLELMRVMREFNHTPSRVMIHCFTGSYDQAKEALDAGFYLSFSGILTFKNAEYLRDVFKKVPLERILLETDAPFLAPVPMRGKMNEPSYLTYTAQVAAELLGLKIDVLADKVTQNFYNLIGI